MTLHYWRFKKLAFLVRPCTCTYQTTVLPSVGQLDDINMNFLISLGLSNRIQTCTKYEVKTLEY